MAVVSTLLVSLELFSDVGVGQSIVSNSRGEEPEFLNTAWTIKIIRGFVLWIICLIMTVPAAQFYEDERLLWLLPFIALGSSIPVFSLLKNQKPIRFVHSNLLYKSR